MTAPTGTVTFDQPDGGYNEGDPVKATVSGVSADTTVATRTLDLKLTDSVTSEETDISGTYSVNKPDPLTSAVASSDNTSPWQQIAETQTGTAYAATYTTTAG